MSVKRIGKKALEYDKISGCSQSVLLALQEDLGIGDQESFKAATVLSGGVARHGETCGALLGGLMALGLVKGRENIRDTKTYVAAMEPAEQIIKEFKKRLQMEFGFDEPLNSTICWEIQERVYGRSFNLNDADDYKAFIDAGGHSDLGCPKVCSVAAEVAAEKLIDLIKKR
jgi:C_GCAxxG_C_C family probable redox protein